jgi:acetyl esterase/lipase
MLQKFKVWALRKYYRHISARGWKSHIEDTPYSSLQIPTAEGPVPARMYASTTGAGKPLIIYFHGGGWVIGDLDTYLGNCGAEEPRAKHAMPLHSKNLATLPPTLLITAEFDPLRDEGIAYAKKLRDAGVALQYRHFDTAAHGFACSEGPNENFNVFMDDLVTWIKQLGK